jgi:hypothetical protein
MTEIIRRLPADLINIIISYTYTPQPIEIRKDIRSYFETKKTIRNIFYERYEYMLVFERDADLNWLVCDLLCFMNRSRNRFYKQETSLFYEIYKKNAPIKKISNPTYNRELHTEFGVYWALLTPEERIRFINLQIKHKTYTAREETTD